MQHFPSTCFALTHLTDIPLLHTQMGFGLHAGKAVQGALGSQWKLDATYVGENVDRAEFLESSTKQFGLKMLMSGDFHKLLHVRSRNRCRKIDQVAFLDNEEKILSIDEVEEIMELFTFDMDIDALWYNIPRASAVGFLDEPTSQQLKTASDLDSRRHKSDVMSAMTLLKNGKSKRSLKRRASLSNSSTAIDLDRMRKLTAGTARDQESKRELITATPVPIIYELNERGVPKDMPDLKNILPTGRVLYDHSVWTKDQDLRKIRECYSTGSFFQEFASGLELYFSKDWEHARECFLGILKNIDDGPSHHFLNIIDGNNGIPPSNFSGYTKA